MDEGLIVILKAIKDSHARLEKLDVSQNHIKLEALGFYDGKDLLLASVLKLGCLKECILSHNGISS